MKNCGIKNRVFIQIIQKPQLIFCCFILQMNYASKFRDA
jgi:hypothetical protein